MSTKQTTAIEAAHHGGRRCGLWRCWQRSPAEALLRVAPPHESIQLSAFRLRFVSHNSPCFIGATK